LRPLSPFRGLILFAIWIAAEITLFNLVASWTGGGPAFFLLVMKSVVGALVVQQAVRRKLVELLRRGAMAVDGPDAVVASIKGLAAFLLIAPGFGAGLLSLALLSPPLQRWITARSGVKRTPPRGVDLSEAEWRETPGAAGPRLPRREEGGTAG
jgi:UPF0716 family protein affecting phage T7 exclusion